MWAHFRPLLVQKRFKKSREFWVSMFQKTWKTSFWATLILYRKKTSNQDPTFPLWIIVIHIQWRVHTISSSYCRSSTLDWSKGCRVTLFRWKGSVRLFLEQGTIQERYYFCTIAPGNSTCRFFMVGPTMGFMTLISSGKLC